MLTVVVNGLLMWSIVVNTLFSSSEVHDRQKLVPVTVTEPLCNSTK
jgi:hypothetical protein